MAGKQISTLADWLRWRIVEHRGMSDYIDSFYGVDEVVTEELEAAGLNLVGTVNPDGMFEPSN